MELIKQVRVIQAVWGAKTPEELWAACQGVEDMAELKQAWGWPPAPLDALAFAILEGEIGTECELVDWLDRQGIVGIPTVEELPFAEPPDPAA